MNTQMGAQMGLILLTLSLSREVIWYGPSVNLQYSTNGFSIYFTDLKQLSSCPQSSVTFYMINSRRRSYGTRWWTFFFLGYKMHLTSKFAKYCI